MCEPVTIATTVAVAASAVMKAAADKSASDANAATLRRNAKLAEDAASDALQRGELDVARVQMQGDAVRGKQITGYASQGVDVGSGSAARTLAGTEYITEWDKLTARNNAQREAWGLKNQADQYSRESARTERAGDYAVVSDLIGGVSGAAQTGLKGLQNAGYFAETPSAPGRTI
jgi:hypothetical protein